MTSLLTVQTKNAPIGPIIRVLWCLPYSWGAASFQRVLKYCSVLPNIMFLNFILKEQMLLGGTGVHFQVTQTMVQH